MQKNWTESTNKEKSKSTGNLDWKQESAKWLQVLPEQDNKRRSLAE